MNVTYTTRNDENEPVTIEANLDFEPQSDDTVWMLWAFAPLKTSDGAGGCAEEERRTLDAINATLGEVLELRNGGLYAGMRLHEGWAELYYYAAWSRGAEQQFRDAFKQHGYAHIEFGANRDAQQAFYYETLYPDACELQQVKSREIIEELSRAGDDLSKPRPVEHYLFFQTQTAMQRAAMQLSEAGPIETGLHEEGRYPHGLVLELEHACLPDVLEAETAPLIELAEKEHGIYRGWSTVMAGDDA
ncbi:MAG: ribonuclease E inhibitor RraB [Campylobacterales bacterium]|jgi:regulator of RNase E activity RraB